MIQQIATALQPVTQIGVLVPQMFPTHTMLEQIGLGPGSEQIESPPVVTVMMMSMQIVRLVQIGMTVKRLLAQIGMSASKIAMMKVQIGTSGVKMAMMPVQMLPVQIASPPVVTVMMMSMQIVRLVQIGMTVKRLLAQIGMSASKIAMMKVQIGTSGVKMAMMPVQMLPVQIAMMTVRIGMTGQIGTLPG